MKVTREEKEEQLEKVLQSQTLKGSESLREFLRFVAFKAMEHQEEHLKEYVIATEVFGRGSNFDPRIDSVVRVQAGRLRTKLQEYYATEGKYDKVLIDLPKGQYVPVFSYNQTDNGAAGAAPSGSRKSLTEVRVIPTQWWRWITAGAMTLALIFGLWGFSYRSEVLYLRETLSAVAAGAADRQAALPLWGDLLSSAEPILVVYSNTLFEGSAETGMKLLKPLDAPGSTLGSPILPQSEIEKSTQPLTEHYTGIGEVMGAWFLGDFFVKVGHSARMKRSLLLTWEDLKTENIVVLGSPAENFFLRDLPQNQDFIFRPLKDEKGQNTFGIINTRPQDGEQQIYLAKQEGPSRSQISEDYAVVSLLRGLSEKNRMLILAGITTLGTQAAVEYVTRPEYIKDLIAHLNQAPPGAAPRLPPYYQVLIKVKVNGGVPVHVSYVSHHVLNQ